MSRISESVSEIWNEPSLVCLEMMVFVVSTDLVSCFPKKPLNVDPMVDVADPMVDVADPMVDVTPLTIPSLVSWSFFLRQVWELLLRVLLRLPHL